MKNNNRNANSLIFLIAVFLTSILLNGCPHHLVEQLDKIIPDDSVLRRYRPVYRTKSVPVDRRGYLENLLSPDSSVTLSRPGKQDSLSYASEKDSSHNPVLTEIVAVEHEDYPDSVVLKAIVYDKNGKYISGLAPPDFRGRGTFRDYWIQLTDSCRDRKTNISDFDVVEVSKKTAEPHAIAFVLDHSPSMGHKKALKLQKAVRLVMTALSPDDWFSVIKFTNIMTTEIPMTNDMVRYKDSLKTDGLRGTDYGSGTAIYDGAMTGLKELSEAPESHHRVMILFSDGVDNSSKVSLDQMRLEAKKHGIVIHTIAYGLAATEPLIKIAEYTGGRFYHIISSKEFPYVFADIYLTLKNHYRIIYEPPVCDGRHTAEVSLAFPGTPLPRLNAEGYYDKSVFKKEDPVGTSYTATIEFDFGKADIRKESMPVIEKIARSLIENPDIEILVSGHTDNVGSDEFNLELSEKRAFSVKKALVSLGVDAGRIETKGLGETMPVAPNSTEENRRKNRRTEFKIIAN